MIGKPRIQQAAFIAAALALGGCGSNVAAVENPQTGQTETCSGPGMNEMNPWGQRDACLADHIAQGWTVKMKTPE